MSVELVKHGPIIQTASGGTFEDVSIEASAEALTSELQKWNLAQGVAVLWEMQDVLWGRAESGRLSFPANKGENPLYWQELRVFNEEAELHLVRRGENLVGRYRSDAGGERLVEYVDAMSRLWGERDEDQSEVPEGFVRLSDKGRGLSMVVPFDGSPSQWCGLVTRNYIKADEETWQAGYADMRFVSVVDADMKGA